MDYTLLKPEDIINIKLNDLILDQVHAISAGVIVGIILGIFIGIITNFMFQGLPMLIEYIINLWKKKQ